MPAKVSMGESLFEFQCKAYGLTPLREHRFHLTRMWRFDFAFPESKIAVEIEGGIWNGGAHTRGKHFESDCEKYNAAVLDDWQVLRYSTGMVESGKAIADVLELILPNGEGK